ncbi:Hypothetical predicted protein [Octopus vulgaris]|uniref:Uncharacterized protein n=1 Tax=Octopus vulgaris TaxID=6645 RepID=A0AA36ATC7_OCTVU|nr:Hypothetical predicted protein [Octopus vulgaris]
MNMLLLIASFSTSVQLLARLYCVYPYIELIFLSSLILLLMCSVTVASSLHLVHLETSFLPYQCLLSFSVHTFFYNISFIFSPLCMYVCVCVCVCSGSVVGFRMIKNNYSFAGSIVAISRQNKSLESPVLPIHVYTMNS